MCNPCQTCIFHLSAKRDDYHSTASRERAAACARTDASAKAKTRHTKCERRRQTFCSYSYGHCAEMKPTTMKAIEWIHTVVVVVVARPTAKTKKIKFRVRCNMFARKVKLKIFWFRCCFFQLLLLLLSNYIFRSVRMAIIAIFTRTNEWFLFHVVRSFF